MIKQQRFESFDSLRGLAALTVVLHHLNIDYQVFTPAATPLLYNSIFHVFYDGKAAVDFFFVLSGFVLSYKYVREEFRGFETMDYGAYMIARIFRLYPLAIAVISLCVIAAALVPHSFTCTPAPIASSLLWNEHFNLMYYLKQISLVWLNAVPEKYLYATQSWSLRIEMMISAIIPFMILLSRRRISWLIIFTLVIIFFFEIQIYIFLFTIGIMLAIYLPRINAYMSAKSRMFKAGMLLCGIFLYSYMFSVAAHLREGSALRTYLGNPWGFFPHLIIATGVVLILICALHSSLLSRILHLPIMKFLGKISYSIYLCHGMLLVIAIPRIILLMNNHGIHDANIIMPVAAISLVIITVILSWILYYIIEKPGIDLGKKVIAYYNGLNTKAL